MVCQELCREVVQYKTTKKDEQWEKLLLKLLLKCFIFKPSVLWIHINSVLFTVEMQVLLKAATKWNFWTI